ncbi:MAG: hypothetical protein K2M48_02835 [Clostridiales bacterium]|nr:hypothetical protein [Clostridiales bacterium]
MSELRRNGSDLTELISELRMPEEEADIRLNLTGKNWRGTADTVIKRLTAISERLLTISGDNYEGVRAYVSHAKGYFIVRTSVHDPVLPIYIESDKNGGAVSIARFLKSFLGGFRGIDCAPLDDYIANEEARLESEREEADGEIGEDDGVNAPF